MPGAAHLMDLLLQHCWLTVAGCREAFFCIALQYLLQFDQYAQLSVCGCALCRASLVHKTFIVFASDQKTDFSLAEIAGLPHLNSLSIEADSSE